MKFIRVIKANNKFMNLPDRQKAEIINNIHEWGEDSDLDFCFMFEYWNSFPNNAEMIREVESWGFMQSERNQYFDLIQENDIDGLAELSVINSDGPRLLDWNINDNEDLKHFVNVFNMYFGE